MPPMSSLFAFTMLYLSYCCCYLCRKNFAVLIPVLSSAEVGLLLQTQSGLVQSCYETVNGIVAFSCGTMIDRTRNTARLLGLTLILAGGATAGMLISLLYVNIEELRVGLVAVFWSCNGVAQALAWPALSTVFLKYFPDVTTRGTWYSLLSTSQNLASTIVPKAVKYMKDDLQLGWASGLLVPSAITTGFGLTVVGLLHMPARSRDDNGKGAKSGNRPFSESFAQLRLNKSFVLLCCAYTPVMFLRMSFSNWTASAFQANGIGASMASCVALFEIGAFGGGLAAGYLSDKLAHGMRGRVMIICSSICIPLAILVGQAIVAAGLATDEDAPQALFKLQALYLLTGAFSFPSHCLMGLFAREVCADNIGTTASCINKGCGQLGSVIAAYPLITLVEWAGDWTVMSLANAVAAGMVFVLLLPLWNVKPLSAKQTSDDRKDKKE